MSVNYSFSDNLMYIRIDGELDVESISRLVLAIESEELKQDEPFHRLIDFSGITKINLPQQAIEQISERRKEMLVAFSHDSIRSAFVLKDDFPMDLFNLYRQYIQTSYMDVECFFKMSEATEWLSKDVVFLQH